MYQNFDEPSLTNAIGLLRDKSQWPASFGPWNYRDCRTCAMGLFAKKWGNNLVTTETTAKLIGISETKATNIFAHLGAHYGTVTPEIVATKLEELV